MIVISRALALSPAPSLPLALSLPPISHLLQLYNYQHRFPTFSNCFRLSVSIYHSCHIFRAQRVSKKTRIAKYSLKKSAHVALYEFWGVYSPIHLEIPDIIYCVCVCVCVCVFQDAILITLLPGSGLAESLTYKYVTVMQSCLKSTWFSFVSTYILYLRRFVSGVYRF